MRAHDPADPQRAQAKSAARSRAACVHQPAAVTSPDAGAKPTIQRTLHFHYRGLLILLRLVLLLLRSMGLALLLSELLQRCRVPQEPTCNRIRLTSGNERIGFSLLDTHLPRT